MEVAGSIPASPTNEFNRLTPYRFIPTADAINFDNPAYKEARHQLIDIEPLPFSKKDYFEHENTDFVNEILSKRQRDL